MTPPPFQIDGLTWTVLDERSGVQDDKGVWRRDDFGEVEKLDPSVFALVHQCCETGTDFMREEKPKEAHGAFLGVLELVPKPLGRWNAVGWALVALGHVHVIQGSWTTARQVLSDAMWSPGVFGNPWAHRLKGQVHLALSERDRAIDDLARAYMGAGREVFKGAGPECMALLEQVLEPEGLSGIR
ncbi:MAG TPA: hypothetical protein QGF58_25185 [Myxococcota bacterium]|nr:hypothetical protein [Myxococcota bacterium]